LDLLNEQNPGTKCIIREDPETGVFISGCNSVNIASVEEGMRVYKTGDEFRITALTKMVRLAIAIFHTLRKTKLY